MFINCAFFILFLVSDFITNKCEAENFEIKKLITTQEKSYIAKLEDETGAKYIIKQTRGGEYKAFYRSIVEAMGSRICAEAGIRSNQVKIIPKDANNEIKEIKNVPASLHTYISGKSLFEFHEYRNMTLKLGCRECKHGLTEMQVRSMSAHRSFPKIVALDTFLGNIDRSFFNIILEKRSNKLYIIDFGLIFHFNVIEKSRENVRQFRKDIFNQKELDALRAYCSKLEELYQRFSEEALLRIYDECVAMTGYSQEEIQNNEKFQKVIHRQKSMIQAMYKEGPGFIEELKQFLG